MNRNELRLRFVLMKSAEALMVTFTGTLPSFCTLNGPGLSSVVLSIWLCAREKETLLITSDIAVVLMTVADAVPVVEVANPVMGSSAVPRNFPNERIIPPAETDIAIRSKRARALVLSSPPVSSMYSPLIVFPVCGYKCFLDAQRLNALETGPSRYNSSLVVRAAVATRGVGSQSVLLRPQQFLGPMPAD